MAGCIINDIYMDSYHISFKIYGEGVSFASVTSFVNGLLLYQITNLQLQMGQKASELKVML